MICPWPAAYGGWADGGAAWPPASMAVPMEAAEQAVAAVRRAATDAAEARRRRAFISLHM
ncbi:hypothetical protein GCM10027090_12150 [Sinomonas soli]